MIYTSYYANANKIPFDWILYGISNSIPNMNGRYIYKGYKYIPNWDIVDAHKRGEITDKEFIDSYRKQLDENLDERNLEQLKKVFTSSKNIVFMCYEKPPKFCHRHILSEYLKEKIGIDIKEFNN